jgi:predicted DNA-binding antitoxin AbrB/MazE fold protein
MTQEFDAIFEGGVLRPVVPLPLAENERVRVVITARSAAWDDDDAGETLAAIQEGLADIEAGRTQPFEDFDREFRARHGIPPRS